MDLLFLTSTIVDQLVSIYNDLCTLFRCLGYGRAFRDRLYENWGEADIVDVCEGAKHLIEQGRVDKNNIFICGSSASGYGGLLLDV